MPHLAVPFVALAVATLLWPYISAARIQIPIDVVIASLSDGTSAAEERTITNLMTDKEFIPCVTFTSDAWLIIRPEVLSAYNHIILLLGANKMYDNTSISVRYEYNGTTLASGGGGVSGGVCEGTDDRIKVEGVEAEKGYLDMVCCVYRLELMLKLFYRKTLKERLLISKHEL